MSPISSRNSEPPSACSNRPMRCLSAPVKAPFSWPNSSDSSRFSCSAAQFTFTKLRAARSELWWIAPAISSLPGPRLPADQHRRVALRDLLHDVEHLLKRGARTDDLVEFVDVLLGAAEILELVLQAPHLERFLDLDLHLLDLERLLNVVERADLHRLDGGGHRPERRHQNHGRRRVQRPGGAQHVEAVASAHLEIAQHDIEVAVVSAARWRRCRSTPLRSRDRLPSAPGRAPAAARHGRRRSEFCPLRSLVST